MAVANIYTKSKYRYILSRTLPNYDRLVGPTSFRQDFDDLKDLYVPVPTDKPRYSQQEKAFKDMVYNILWGYNYESDVETKYNWAFNTNVKAMYNAKLGDSGLDNNGLLDCG